MNFVTKNIQLSYMQMKKYILILSTVIITVGMFTSCSVGRTTETKALENQAYLQFLRGTTEKYSDGVTIYLDNEPPFKAKVNKVKSTTVKGNVYVIYSGKRHLRVEYKGDVIYDKDIFLSSQESRVVQLP